MSGHDKSACRDLVRDVEEFLYLEADLLDERRYKEWLELLSEDIRYRIPLRKNMKYSDSHLDISGADDMSWMDDDRETLVKRVKQIMTGIHWAEEPQSRVSHLVTNVRITNPAEALAGSADILVSSRVLVHRNRLEGETDYFIGRRNDIVRRNGDGFLLAGRTVILDQATLLAKNLTIFI
ncbi:MAG: 3-phenylpropionate/cinnamic acid dioxygenase subunit beta [Pseudomonadota bacterium]